MDLSACSLADPVTVDGDHVHLDSAQLVRPRPIQNPLPILVGGNNRELIRHAGRVADIVEVTGLGRTLDDGHFHAIAWADAAVDERVELFRTASKGRNLSSQIERAGPACRSDRRPRLSKSEVPPEPSRSTAKGQRARGQCLVARPLCDDRHNLRES
jgi:alkanesulfonate monooxygenase SsuD/methylene tetrahydromethanopterin reductase-like flavin-dependent oxidoreductase (luciferase family)